MDIEKFGPFIQSCRKRKQMTQEELAQKLHVTDKAISRWERGVGFPDIKLLEPLAQALDLSVAELLRAEREEPVTQETLVVFADEGKRTAQYRQGLRVCRIVTMVLVAIMAYYAGQIPEPWWIHPLALLLLWGSRLCVEMLLRRAFRPEIYRPQPAAYHVMFAVFGAGLMMQVFKRSIEIQFDFYATILWDQVGSILMIAGLVGMFFNDKQLDI